MQGDSIKKLTTYIKYITLSLPCIISQYICIISQACNSQLQVRVQAAKVILALRQTTPLVVFFDVLMNKQSHRKRKKIVWCGIDA